MIDVTEEKDLYQSSFSQFNQDRLGKEPTWLHEIRQAAFDRFVEMGFPTTRDEEWRFTSVAPLTKNLFKPASPKLLSRGTLQRFMFGHRSEHLLVFVNGHFSRELSSLPPAPKGLQLDSIAAVLEGRPESLDSYLACHASYERHAFVALNTAFIEDGAFVCIPRDTVVQMPIHLLFVSTSSGTPSVSYPRNLIIAGSNSQARIVESYVGIDGEVYFTNAVTEIVAGENAVIDHYKVQRESVKAFHVATTQIQQSRSSNFSSLSITLGGSLVRNDVNTVLDGEGCESILNGLYMVSGDQLVDNHTQIDHAKAHCSSREFYKGILDERARGVFNGRIIVRPGAQKTDSKQTNKNLLLSEEALVNTNPQLEIYADDVKCTHGATIGQLSADALFYLRSRGIGLEAARSLLVHAFASDITSRIKIDTLRVALEQLLFSRFPQEEKVVV